MYLLHYGTEGAYAPTEPGAERGGITMLRVYLKNTGNTESGEVSFGEHLFSNWWQMLASGALGGVLLKSLYDKKEGLYYIEFDESNFPTAQEHLVEKIPAEAIEKITLLTHCTHSLYLKQGIYQSGKGRGKTIMNVYILGLHSSNSYRVLIMGLTFRAVKRIYERAMQGKSKPVYNFPAH